VVSNDCVTDTTRHSTRSAGLVICIEFESNLQRDSNFLPSFDAWRDMDKQLCTQFIARPFAVEPYSATYIQALERAHMDSFLRKAQDAQTQFEACHYRSHGPHHAGSHPEWAHSSSASNHYAPYDKDKPRASNSFWDNKKLALCLRCGLLGHWAGSCSATQSSHPDCPIICEWHNDKLTNKSNRHI